MKPFVACASIFFLYAIMFKLTIFRVEQVCQILKDRETIDNGEKSTKDEPSRSETINALSLRSVNEFKRPLVALFSIQNPLSSPTVNTKTRRERGFR